MQLEVRVSEEMESVWLRQRRVCPRAAVGSRPDGISVCHTHMLLVYVYSYIYRKKMSQTHTLLLDRDSDM